MSNVAGWIHSRTSSAEPSRSTMAYTTRSSAGSSRSNSHVGPDQQRCSGRRTTPRGRLSEFDQFDGGTDDLHHDGRSVSVICTTSSSNMLRTETREQSTGRSIRPTATTSCSGGPRSSDRPPRRSPTASPATPPSTDPSTGTSPTSPNSRDQHHPTELDVRTVEVVRGDLDHQPHPHLHPPVAPRATAPTPRPAPRRRRRGLPRPIHLRHRHRQRLIAAACNGDGRRVTATRRPARHRPAVVGLRPDAVHGHRLISRHDAPKFPSWRPLAAPARTRRTRSRREVFGLVRSLNTDAHPDQPMNPGPSGSPASLIELHRHDPGRLE